MVRCSSVNNSIIGKDKKKGMMEKFKDYKGENNENKNIDELILVLNSAENGVILLIEYGSISLKNRIIKGLEEKTNFSFYNIILDKKNKNLPAIVNECSESKKINEDTVILVHNIETAMPEIIGYLNWHREIFLNLRTKTVIFCPIYIIDEILVHAPDFYRFSYKITFKEKEEFIKTAEAEKHFLISDIYYEDENELTNRIKIQEHLLKNVRDDYKIADISFNLGRLYFLKNEYAKSIEHSKKSAEISKKLGDMQGYSTSLTNLGLVYMNQGKWDEATSHFKESMEIFKKLGDMQGYSASLTNLGIIYANQEKWDKAISHFKESMEITKKLGDMQGYSKSLTNLGSVYMYQGKWDDAINIFKEAENNFKNLGDIHSLAIAYENLGIIYRKIENINKAIACYENAKNLYFKLGLADRVNEISNIISEIKTKNI